MEQPQERLIQIPDLVEQKILVENRIIEQMQAIDLDIISTENKDFAKYLSDKVIAGNDFIGFLQECAKDKSTILDKILEHCLALLQIIEKILPPMLMINTPQFLINALETESKSQADKYKKTNPQHSHLERIRPIIEAQKSPALNYKKKEKDDRKR